MHELSIVEALIKQCEKHVEEQNATKILKVEIKIGQLSGVEAHYLKTSFDAFKKGTICHEAKLVIYEQKIVVFCHECKKKATLDRFEFICPSCQSSDLSIEDGEDMYLLRLEMC